MRRWWSVLTLCLPRVTDALARGVPPKAHRRVLRYATLRCAAIHCARAGRNVWMGLTSCTQGIKRGNGEFSKPPCTRLATKRRGPACAGALAHATRGGCRTFAMAFQ